MVGPSLNEEAPSQAARSADANQSQESEIAEEMKIRLQLVR